ncbi:MAG: DNA helicase UvrD [Candidatus Kerfeldbacteria bacterium]|nr:DNA helicase UvrD [Candidatus Kerfeldbacteria bacterium]
MRVIADLEIHSRFARAVSPDMNVATMETWGMKKGVEVIGTGDFTHPEWFAELKAGLEDAAPGLYKQKGSSSSIRFVLSAEVSCIFGRLGATRRIHILLYAPSFAVAEKINAYLSLIGNLKADGRPILGMDVKDVVKVAMDASPDCLVIPAHVWTPWFGMYGSKSGFNSINECFEDFAKYVPAVETGLSSDPPMNWRLSELDTKSIVSFSDAHSAPNIGRECTILELASLSYQNIAEAIKIPFPKTTDPNRIVMTVEFFPEEGMYHWDGHRDHNIRWSPAETKQHNGICTVCGKPVTVGVMNRVEVLADRPAEYQPTGRPGYQRMVPLAEIISDAIGVGKLSKAVGKIYDLLIEKVGSEFKILLESPLEEIAAASKPDIADGVDRVRRGELNILPGYDGVYGSISIFDKKVGSEVKAGQGALF